MSKRTIGRWPLKIQDYQSITAPRGFTPLSVAPARDTYKHEFMNRFRERAAEDVQGIDLWAMIPLEAQLSGVNYGIYLVGTGNPMPENVSTLDILGTCVMDNRLVWHVFAVQESD